MSIGIPAASNAGTYEMKVRCKNCDFSGSVKIPKGDSLISAMCPKCDLPMLNKA
jgi:hypothetical protein